MLGDPLTTSRAELLKMAFWSEGAILVVAVVLGWLLGHLPTQDLKLNIEGVGLGVIATIPLLVLLALLYRSRWETLVQFRELVQKLLGKPSGCLRVVRSLFDRLIRRRCRRVSVSRSSGTLVQPLECAIRIDRLQPVIWTVSRGQFDLFCVLGIGRGLPELSLSGGAENRICSFRSLATRCMIWWRLSSFADCTENRKRNIRRTMEVPLLRESPKLTLSIPVGQ